MPFHFTLFIHIFLPRLVQRDRVGEWGRGDRGRRRERPRVAWAVPRPQLSPGPSCHRGGRRPCAAPRAAPTRGASPGRWGRAARSWGRASSRAVLLLVTQGHPSSATCTVLLSIVVIFYQRSVPFEVEGVRIRSYRSADAAGDEASGGFRRDCGRCVCARGGVSSGGRQPGSRPTRALCAGDKRFAVVPACATFSTRIMATRVRTRKCCITTDKARFKEVE